MGGSSVVSGDSSDWEVIQNPFSHQPSSPPSHGQLHGYELVIRDNYYDDNFSIFPPSEHEDLPLLEDYNSARVTSPPRSPLSSACSELSTPRRELKIKSYLKPSIIMNEIGTRMYSFGRSVFQVFHCSSSRSSSIFPAAVVVLTLFACAKILQWRNRLLLLVREKDQRISQLLHRISHMNEILSARRKVPVLRIS